MITLRVNGQTHSFPAPLSISELLLFLQLFGKRLAVEMNGEIVPKSRHADTLVEDGAVLEIVVAVGGG